MGENWMSSGISRRAFVGLGLGTLAAQCLRAETGREIWYADEPTGEAALNMPIMKGFAPTKLTISVGATQTFKYMHLSDSHLAQMDSRDLWRADDVEFSWYETRRRHFANNGIGLAAALLYAKVHRLPIIHTGDLLDYASDANVRWGQRELEGWDCLYALGNHEHCGTPRPGPRGADLPLARAKLQPFLPNNLTVCSKTVNGVNFVAFDNVGMSADLYESQFAAIKAEFAKGLPVVLLCHIPFYTPDLAEVTAKDAGLAVSDLSSGYLACIPGKGDIQINKTLGPWLKEQPNLKAILCGHLHREYQGVFSGAVKQYVAGATYLRNAYEITFV